jgi:hypothetical protein
MLMTHAHKTNNLEKDHEKLVREALKLPGVADLIAVYKRFEPSYQRGQQYL